jgi:3-hydroxybutyryl-CoA dehydrogenase
MNIAVVGSGQMGAGIAQVMASAGHDVWLYDSSADAALKARGGIQRRLERAALKGTIAAENISQVIERIRNVSTLDAISQQNIAVVIEAVPEVFEIKHELFDELDTMMPASTILASNTSSISITKLAAATGRADRVVGMHFMHPVPSMKLVEIVRGLRTSKETVATIEALSLSCDKTSVLAEDQPGFVANRILMPMLNEAIFTLSEGVADVAGIDIIMQLGMNHPMGPLALADFIGLDTCLAILEVLHAGFGDPKYRPCPLLRRMVDAGRLGRKVGEGFYRYSAAGERREAVAAV